jgi:hypothetical protein
MLGCCKHANETSSPLEKMDYFFFFLFSRRALFRAVLKIWDTKLTILRKPTVAFLVRDPKMFWNHCCRTVSVSWFSKSLLSDKHWFGYYVFFGLCIQHRQGFYVQLPHDLSIILTDVYWRQNLDGINNNPIITLMHYPKYEPRRRVSHNPKLPLGEMTACPILDLRWQIK